MDGLLGEAIPVNIKCVLLDHDWFVGWWGRFAAAQVVETCVQYGEVLVHCPGLQLEHELLVQGKAEYPFTQEGLEFVVAVEQFVPLDFQTGEEIVSHGNFS